MDKQLRIILTYQDQATAGLAKTVSAIGAATSGLRAGIAKGFSSLAGMVGGAVSRIKGFITGMVSHFRWASLFIGMMAVGAGAKLLGIAANAEQTRVAFETLLGSPKEAGAFMKWIEDLSIKTPLMRSEIEQAAKTFLAYGIPLKTAKKATMAAVEATSALGLENDKLARISVNLGQIYNSQRVREVELRELRLAGVSVNKIFTNAIKDGTIKVQGYGSAVGVAAGASKKLTNANIKAKETIEDATWKTDKMTAAVNKAKDKFGESSWQYKKATESLGDWSQKVGEANGTITTFTKVQENAGKTLITVKNNIKDVDEETLTWIKDNMTGKEIFEVLEKGMLKLYGGASIRQVKTFSGAMSNFGDVFAKVVKRAMGISAEGEIQVGGAFDKIRNAAAKMVEYLINNVDKIGVFFNKILSNKDTLIGLAGFLIGMLIPAFAGLILPIVIVGGAIAILSVFINRLVERYGGWKKVIDDSRTALDNLIKFIDEHQTTFKVLAFIVGIVLVAAFIAWAIAAGIAAVNTLIALAPIILIVGAIMAIVGLLYLAWVNNWGGIQEKVRAVVDWFNGTAKPILETAFEIIKKAAKILFELWKELVDKVWEALKKLINFISDTFVPVFEDRMNFIKGIIEKMIPTWVKQIDTMSGAFQKVADTIGNVLGKINELSRKATGKGITGDIAKWVMKAIMPGAAPFLQHGGIVPGQVGQAVPIMAHGGERIMPRGSNTQAPFGGGGGGGGVTVNMNGPITMDSPERVKELAGEIIKIMGRQSELSRYGLL